MSVELNHSYRLYGHIFTYVRFKKVEDIGAGPMTLPTVSGCSVSSELLTLQLLKSGGYRSRTDDPLRARQVL